MISYDPLKVNLIVDGVAITGYAEGTFIEVERNEDAVMPYVGTKGEVSFAENADESGKIKVTLASTSPQILFLNTLSKKKGDDASFAVSLVNMNTNAVSASGNDCRVIKMAKEELSDEVTEREFEIFVGHLDMQ